MSFRDLGLAADLLRAVEAQGYTQPTPIQAKAIPEVLAGRDVLAGAQTGTGKTAAFTLPMLQLLDDGRRAGSGQPRALVLVPTRELAAQVADSIQTYGAHLRLRSAVIFGGVNIKPQKDLLQRGIEILVATPGRLLDHAGQGTVDLSRIEILVLDEADRMLDMGFIHDIRRVLRLLPKKRQNLLFSATYSEEIRSLADGLLHRPAEVEVARRNTAAENVTQHVYKVPKADKRDLLIYLVHEYAWHQVLVFTRTKHGANRLAEQLVRAGLEAAAIHGNKSQNARTRALAGFKDGSVRVLVATDIAARGLDIHQLPHVVNYELPNVSEDYVHRIGRTGRAGEEGDAVSLVGEDETKLLRDIERLLNRRIPVLERPKFTPRTLGPPPPKARPSGRRTSGGGRSDRGSPGDRPGNRAAGPGRGRSSRGRSRGNVRA